MRHFPALDLTWLTPLDSDRREFVLADLDDFGPTALEDLGAPDGVRLYFSTAPARDAALARVQERHPAASGRAIDVPDEAWAERSQAALQPVEVGGLVVAPPWSELNPFTGIPVVIQPSMGFGTGHHASTRLCLRLLQSRPVTGLTVLDAGTGSGVLAIAAVKLGARHAVAIDVDPDAIHSAQENVQLNDVAGRVSLREGDFGGALRPDAAPFDIVLANLTGAVLCRLAADLAGAAAPSGVVIASGILTEEAAAVAAAFAATGLAVVEERREEDWIGFLFGRAVR